MYVDSIHALRTHAHISITHIVPPAASMPCPSPCPCGGGADGSLQQTHPMHTHLEHIHNTHTPQRAGRHEPFDQHQSVGRPAGHDGGGDGDGDDDDDR